MADKHPPESPTTHGGSYTVDPATGTATLTERTKTRPPATAKPEPKTTAKSAPKAQTTAQEVTHV